MIFNFNRQLLPEEQEECAKALKSHGLLNIHMTKYTLAQLHMFIIYEVQRKKRRYILDRLIGRYFRLFRTATTNTVLAHARKLEAENERTCDRAVSGGAG